MELLFGVRELLPTSCVLIVDNIDFLNNLTNEDEVETVPNNFCVEIVVYLPNELIYFFGLLLHQIKTYLASPLNLIGWYLPVVKIPILDIVATVPTANRGKIISCLITGLL